METVLNLLRQMLAGICRTVTEFPGTTLRRKNEPVMAVGISSAEAVSGAEYLGTTAEGENELYGMTVKAVFSLDIFAPGGEGTGAALCRSIFDQVLDCFKTRMASGLKITKITCGQLYYDTTASMYRLPCTLAADTFVYAVADECGQFVDFDLRGVTYSA